MFNRKISIHHIGGRAGSRVFPKIKHFEKDLINVLYDADEDCLEQIKERNQRLESELYVLPYALSDQCKTSELNINYDPFTSSLLEKNKSFDEFYTFTDSGYDYIMGESTTVVEKRNINVVSMDHLYNTESIEIPPPDFLSLDVEGGEYNILAGSSETINKNVLAIQTEISFHQLRLCQANFGELFDFLTRNGFYFVKFIGSFEEMSPYRYQIGLRGEGFYTTTDALFLRKIDTVKQMDVESEK